MKEIACLFISSSWAQAVEILVNIFLLIWYVETRFHCITFAGLELNYVDQAGLTHRDPSASPVLKLKMYISCQAS